MDKADLYQTPKKYDRTRNEWIILLKLIISPQQKKAQDAREGVFI